MLLFVVGGRCLRVLHPDRLPLNKGDLCTMGDGYNRFQHLRSTSLQGMQAILHKHSVL